MTAQISRRNMLKYCRCTRGRHRVRGAPGNGGGRCLRAPRDAAHPGHLQRMATRVKAGAEPYTAGFARLTANRHAQSTWTANPQATVYRGSGTPENYVTLYDDDPAYQNALRWHITGDTAHADTARDILNAWSARLTRLDGSADRFLASGLYGYQFANAAELVRGHDGFELARFQKMMLDVFHPVSKDFLAPTTAPTSPTTGRTGT